MKKFNVTWTDASDLSKCYQKTEVVEAEDEVEARKKVMASWPVWKLYGRSIANVELI